MTQLMNDKDVYRGALATPGLLTTLLHQQGLAMKHCQVEVQEKYLWTSFKKYKKIG